MPRTTRVVLVFFAAIFCLGTVQAQPVSVTNGGFEQLDPSGIPSDWSPYSAGEGAGVEVVSDAHTGDRALRLWADAEGAVAGLNRQFSSESAGTMIQRTSGVFAFWYKAVSSSVGGRNLYLTVIAMRANPFAEVARVRFVIPSEHVGDKQWHAGSLPFDFRDHPEVVCVHLGARVNESEQDGKGELLIDDLSVRPLGIVVRIVRLGSSAPVPRQGEGFGIRCLVENRGDVPAAVVATLSAPPALEVASPLERSVRTLMPLNEKRFAWSVHARAPGPVVCTVTVAAGETRVTRAMVVVVRPADGGAPAFTCSSGELVFRVRRAGEAAVGELLTASGKPLGLLPLLGSITCARPNGPETLFVGPQALEEGEMRGSVRDSRGGLWLVRTTIRPEGPGRLLVRSVLECDGARELLAFQPLLVYAGEGGWGRAKDEALFGGLEYLEGAEQSSSTLDIHSPEYLRYLPHPNKVTIPLIAVRNGEAIVGLWWDPLQDWFGNQCKPAPLFASPNTLFEQDNHLMGLMVPPPPEWAEENELGGARPLRLRPGEKVALEATLFALRGDDILAAVRLYCQAVGLPQPASLPERTAEREIQLSVRAYLDTLWMPEEEKWHNTLDSDPWPPSVNPLFIRQLWLASHLIPDPEIARACRERAEKYLPRVGGAPGADLSFHLGRVRASIEAMQGQAEAEMASQGEDGGWRFVPNEQTANLGVAGEEAIGLNTYRALNILRFARLTGDPAALDAGLKALTYMRKFRVPRAAQVWEVPVHAPDILAAGLACEAYVEGYEATGDPQWLADAVRWAQSGLPFLYLWNENDRLWMRYASIPVFGSTFWTHSWFGRAVQWNGLDYGRALFRLARHDDSLPWRQVAVGATHSASLQQDREGRHLALYPDSYDAMTNAKVAWMLAPSGIIRNLMLEVGAPVEANTARVSASGGACRVTACAPISETRYSLAERALTFEVGPGLGNHTFVLVCGVSAPSQVLAGGEALPQVADDPTSVGYAHFEDVNALIIGLSSDSLACRVEVRGVDPRPSLWILPPREEIWFEFSAGAQGWRALNALTPLVQSPKGLATRSTGADPYIGGPPLRVEASRYRRIVVRMAVSAGSGAQTYWTTQDSPHFDEQKVVNIAIVPDGRLRDYVFPVGEHRNWNGVITHLRLDPSNAAAADIVIQSIRGD